MGINNASYNRTAIYFADQEVYQKLLYYKLKSNLSIAVNDNISNSNKVYSNIKIVDNPENLLKYNKFYIGTDTSSIDSEKEHILLSKPKVLFDCSSDFNDTCSKTYFIDDFSFDVLDKSESYLPPMDSDTLIMTQTTFENIVNTACTTVSVYSLSERTLRKKLENTNYVYSNIRMSQDTSRSLNSLLSKVLIFIIIVLGIVIIYFITYFVLGIVYKSKNRDYTILRTLGVSKKQMSNIVSCELLYMSIICLLILLVVCKLIPSTTGDLFFAVARGVNFIEFILFSILFILFSAKIGHRFNKLLLNNTVNKTFKKEEIQND